MPTWLKTIAHRLEKERQSLLHHFYDLFPTVEHYKLGFHDPSEHVRTVWEKLSSRNKRRLSNTKLLQDESGLKAEVVEGAHLDRKNLAGSVFNNAVRTDSI
jgi:hypothetical protein